MHLVNHTRTPKGPLPPLPPGSIAPPGERATDAEGNLTSVHNGHWHLIEPPRNRAFPQKAGANPALVPINPNAAYRELLARGRAVREEQRAASKVPDMQRWFAVLYGFVSELELQKIESGAYLYPHMKLQELIQFQGAYRANLEAWRTGARDKVEAHWQTAFVAGELHGATSGVLRAEGILRTVLVASMAHVRIDLPRAIAACHVLHYAGIPGTKLDDFKADFAMDDVFDGAERKLKAVVDEEVSGADPTGWGPLQKWLKPFMVNLTKERDNSWTKAKYLSSERRGRRSNKGFEQTAGDAITGAHPGSGDQTFTVGGNDVRGEIDWMHNPGEKEDAAAPGTHYEPAPPPPPFPAKLFFRLDRPAGEDMLLEHVIRDDQDLAPYKALAEWTRQVRGAQLLLEGHASEEGTDDYNLSLSARRTFLLRYFLGRCGMDEIHNVVHETRLGRAGAAPGAAWRHVVVRVLTPGTGRQQHQTPNGNLPSEAA
ncbi:MAG TPA: DUF5995 family protein [Kofleriaceae bacterium]|nr:DUF5995 family protein [Kofleriaceae bacterium]